MKDIWAENLLLLKFGYVTYAFTVVFLFCKPESYFLALAYKKTDVSLNLVKNLNDVMKVKKT